MTKENHQNTHEIKKMHVEYGFDKQRFEIKVQFNINQGMVCGRFILL